MSDSHLIGRLTSGPFWQLVRPVLGDDELPVHFAQLRCAQGTDEVSGALFLTSDRLIWRTIDPRRPEGSEFEVSLSDVLGADQPSRLTAFQAFRIVTEDQGHALDTYFFPHHRAEVDKMLCSQMFLAVEAAWQAHRQLRFSA